MSTAVASILRRYAWEWFLVLLILAAGAWSSYLSPYYLSVDQILYSLRFVLIAGLLGLGLMAVIVMAEIDISLPSTLALGTILFAQCSQHAIPIAIAVPVVVIVGIACGVVNGFLVVRFNLPSLAVTLGTMGAYRAFAFLLGGGNGYAGFDASYTWMGNDYFWSNVVPISLILFLVSVIAFIFLMHRTVYGRLAYAIGNNKEATRYSGIRVPLVKVAAFATAGAMAMLGAWVYIGQYGSARSDNASNILLFIVTAVVLGGVDVFGGKGNVIGVALALILLGTLNNGMGLANISGDEQTVNMMNFPKQAQSMLDSALYNVPSGGPSIWIAPTPTTANFISQKAAIDKLIATNAKYKSIKFIDTLYAHDDPEKSYNVGIDAMQAHPNLKLFITGSGISNPAINKAIEATGRKGKVYSTGFALPSTMTTYLADGTCKQFALWDPKEYGYMSTYLCILLKAGKISNKLGSMVAVPGIGSRPVNPTVEVDYNKALYFRKSHDNFGNAVRV